MRTIRFRTAAAAVVSSVALSFCAASAARAQAPAPVSIPLQLINLDNGTVAPQYRLGIYVGINSGVARPYIFDTGSAIFNAVYTQSAWSGFTATPGLSPNSTVANGNAVQYCYGPLGKTGCRGYQGNIVQVQSLNFYTPPALGAQQTVAATLNAAPGYEVNAIDYHLTQSAGGTVYTSIAGATSPTVEGIFYGTFGAGDFASTTNTGYVAGSVLGQTLVSNVAQGYVVAANGQPNPVRGTTNPPQQSNGQKVFVDGVQRDVTPCSPCVTVGLTPEILGQFALVNPTTGRTTGAVPWQNNSGSPALAFPNPYTGGTGITGSVEFGTQFNVTLTSPSGSRTATSIGNTLLDTGTGDLTLSTDLARQPSISNANNVFRDVTLTATGLNASASIPGLATSSSVLQGPDAALITYQAAFDVDFKKTNTLGLSFFLQNSVLFDFSNQAVGYTKFFVTDANLSTVGGALIVGGTNLPLGLAGVISGSGGVRIETDGEVQLSAVNTYTGATTIGSGGRLNIAGIGSIASSGAVTNNGRLDISRAWAPVSLQTLSGTGRVDLGGQQLRITNGDGGIFSGIIADGGSYDIAGGSVALTGGALTLTGANTYTGGTSVSGGAALGIVADSGLGDAAGGLVLNHGTLVAGAAITSSRAVTLGSLGGTFHTNGFDLRLDTPVSGTGGLTKTGPGMFTLSGANSYTGGTIVNEGILQLAAGASLSPIGALTVNGGTFDFNGNNVAVGNLSGVGGTIQLGSSTLTVAEQGNTSFAGVLAGTGGVTMQGPGMLSLTGINTYTGPTNVLGGRLAVNGSITSNVTVGPGGNLGGIGTIFGSVTNNGIASPGNSIGTLTVNGTYTQAPGSSYQVETTSAGQSDLINVVGAPGTATLAGGTVILTAATGVYAPSTTYTILNATGGVTGTYAGTSSLFPFLQSSLSYDANNVYMTLKPGGFAAGAQTANQMAVGRALDRSVAGSSGDFATVIGTMATYTLSQGQAAMAAISGQNYSGFGTANLGGGLLFMNALGQQMSAARGGGNKESRTALALACDVACDGELPSPWSLWASAMGGTGTVAGNANSATLTYNAGGVATGADYRFDPRFLAGIGIGFSSGSQWVSGFSGQGTTNSYQASLYASFTPGAFYVDAMAGYGYNDNQMTRQIVLPNLAARIAQGRTGANQFLGQVEAGYRVGVYEPAAASITPFARFQGTTVSQMGFTESGASSLNLNVASQTTGSARSVLGAEFAGAFGAAEIGGGREKLAMQLRLGWAHEFASTSRPVTASFAGAPGANFTVFGTAPQTDAATVSLAANTAIAPGMSLYLRYDGEMAAGTSIHSLNGGLRISW